MILLIESNDSKKLYPKCRSEDGFTLAEIIVVIGILGLIIGAIYPFLNTINRRGGVSQSNIQQFEDSVNNYFLAISKQIRNANAIDIYDDGNTIQIQLVNPSRTYKYQKNGNSIDVVELFTSSTKKIITEVPNITIDNSVPLFRDLDGEKKNFELAVKITYSVGTTNNSKLFNTSVTKRN